MKNLPRAFSLIELLVALVVLSVLTVIIVPKYLSIKKRASYVNARGQLVKLQEVTQNWIALGGEPNDATPAELLKFLATKGSQLSSTRVEGNPARDSLSNCGSWYISLDTSVNETSPAVEGFNSLDGELFYYFSDGTEIEFLLDSNNRWYTDPSL